MRLRSGPVGARRASEAGGRGGADHYLHIPKGPILRRHVAGLDPYLNDIWALRVSGADLRGILEHAARIYTSLVPGQTHQWLVDSRVPSFDFDTIFGLDYTIDPTRPIGQRITSLRYAGAVVMPDQPFVLATSQFRVAGGGGYQPAEKHQILPCAPMPLSQALVPALNAPDGAALPPVPWHLTCQSPTTAVLRTSPDARAVLEELAGYAPQDLGIDGEGFLHLQVTL